jgi:hypothetical protein
MVNFMVIVRTFGLHNAFVFGVSLQGVMLRYIFTVSQFCLYFIINRLSREAIRHGFNEIC